MQSLNSEECDKRGLLGELCERGIFLIDAIAEEPVNKDGQGNMRSNKERQDLISNNYASLRERIHNLPLKRSTKVFLVHKNVVEAMGAKLADDFLEYEVHSICFPICYNDPRFKERIETCLQKG